MTRALHYAAAFALTLLALDMLNAVIAGFVQCDAADACPYEREFGGVR